MTDHLVRHPLFLVASAGEQANPTAPFVTAEEKPATLEPVAHAPGTEAVLAAIAAAEARAVERHKALGARVDVAISLGQDINQALEGLRVRLDRSLPEPFPGHP